MRRLSVVALLVVLSGFGQAQWLEKELWLPDSMSGLDWPDRIMFNPLNHHAYIGGYEAENIQIFDYTERQKAGMISDVYQVVDILLCPDRQRIVFLEAEHGRLYTLDALTDAVLRHTYICDSLACGIYNPMVHKVYIGARGQTALFVFDPGPDTLLGRIELADHVTEVAFDSATNRLFGMASEGSDHAIKVLDCVRDTLVGVLPTMAKACVDLAIDPAGRRLYCLGRNSAFNCEIWVYDMDSLAVLDTIALADTWCDDPAKLLLNPAASRLYARGMADGRRDRVAVIDSEADTIIRFIDLGDANNVLGWCLDRTDNKVYICAEGLDSVAVLGAPDSVTGWVRTGNVGWCVGWNPENDELLVPDQHNMLSVVSGANDSILVQLNYMRFLLGALSWNPTGDKLYAFGFDAGVMVIDAQNNIVKHLRSHIFSPGCAPVLSPDVNRLYAPTGNSMAVLDCSGDSFLFTKPMPFELADVLYLVPEQHKIYWSSHSDSTAVYDIYSDSVTRIRFGLGTQFVYNSRANLVYSFTWDDTLVRVIDPGSDSVLGLINTMPAYSLAANPTDNELYVGSTLTEEKKVYVVDCSTNTVEDTINLLEPAKRLYWYEPLDKLYVLGDNVISVVDCRSHTVTKTIPVGDHAWFEATAYSEGTDRLWVATDDSLWVIHCPTDSIVAVFPGFYWQVDIVSNSIDNRVYQADFCRLRIYRDEVAGLSAPTLDADVRLSLRPGSNPAAGEVRFECTQPDREPGLFRIFDAAGRQVWSSSVGAGQRSVVWPGRDGQGRRVPPGVCLARLESGTKQATVKVVLR